MMFSLALVPEGMWSIGRAQELMGSSILCSDFAIKRIDEPFTSKDDDPNEWAL